MDRLKAIEEQIINWMHSDSIDLHELEYAQNPSYRNLDDNERHQYVYKLMKQDLQRVRLMSLLKFIKETK